MNMSDIKITKELFESLSLADSNGIVSNYMCIMDYNPEMVVDKIVTMQKFAIVAKYALKSEVEFLKIKIDLYMATEADKAKYKALVEALKLAEDI